MQACRDHQNSNSVSVTNVLRGRGLNNFPRVLARVSGPTYSINRLCQNFNTISLHFGFSQEFF